MGGRENDDGIKNIIGGKGATGCFAILRVTCYVKMTRRWFSPSLPASTVLVGTGDPLGSIPVPGLHSFSSAAAVRRQRGRGRPASLAFGTPCPSPRGGDPGYADGDRPPVELPVDAWEKWPLMRVSVSKSRDRATVPRSGTFSAAGQPPRRRRYSPGPGLRWNPLRALRNRFRGEPHGI